MTEKSRSQIDGLKALYGIADVFFADNDIEGFDEWLQRFCNEDTDVNTLKTLLIITAHLKQEGSPSYSTRKRLLNIFNEKMEAHDRQRKENIASA